MPETVHWLTSRLWTIFPLISLSVVPAAADQHSVEAIAGALKSSISPGAVAAARDFDDKIMSAGNIEGIRVYLVTDERSTRVNGLVGGLLRGAGHDPSEWVVRVLDTDPKLVNAFVVGGKYVYVYSGLLAQNPSDDELAFILSHELGHSLLKHNQRRDEDPSSTWAAIAGLAALFSEKHREALTTIATAITSSYSRLDEEEADALAACIARRGGYDPLRGADFFTRSQREQDAHRQRRDASLAQARGEFDQAQATCQQWHQWYQGSWTNQTQANADKVNAICQDAERNRLRYNQIVQQYNAEVTAERRNVLLSTHPQDKSRVAAIAALADFLAGRRDASTLAKYVQTSRVIVALQQEESDLLKPGGAPEPKVTSESSSAAARGSLEDQLKQLQRARDQGLITQAEYERKRQEILARY